MQGKWTIKKFIAGCWMYYTEQYNTGTYDAVRNWSSDFAIAKQFDGCSQSALLKALGKGTYVMEAVIIVD